MTDFKKVALALTLSFLVLVFSIAPVQAAEEAGAQPAYVNDGDGVSEPPAEVNALAPARQSKKLKLPKIGNSKGHVTIGGIKRSYVLHLPSGFNEGERLPLIIVLHGALGNAWTGEWDSLMSRQADKDHFIVVYPNGFLKTWNAGQCCGLARLQNIDDVAFISTLIDKLEDELGVDPERVYVTGISNGAMLSYRLGCELSDKIAAIAPVEGCLYPSKCEHPHPVSVVAFHGKKDKIVRFEGGYGSMLGYIVKAPSVASAIEFWKKVDQCSSEPVTEEDDHFIKEVYSGGCGGTEVCLYTLKDGGHAWPGGRRATFLGDVPKNYLPATEIMCQFFWAHPKKKQSN